MTSKRDTSWPVCRCQGCDRVGFYERGGEGEFSRCCGDYVNRLSPEESDDFRALLERRQAAKAKRAASPRRLPT